MHLRHERNCGNMDKLYNILVLDPQDNLKYVLSENMIQDYEGLYPLFFKDHFEWHRSDTENIILHYEEDFTKNHLTSE